MRSNDKLKVVLKEWADSFTVRPIVTEDGLNLKDRKKLSKVYRTQGMELIINDGR